MRYHQLLHKNYDSWMELEKEIAKLPTDKLKGDVMEQFAKIYFLLNKDLYNVEEVFMREEVPSDIIEELRLEATDYGVDGVIVRQDGKLVAYQVKFRTDGSQPSYRELATFWTESEYADFRLIFTNTNTLPTPTRNRKSQLAVLWDTLDNLEKDFFGRMSDIAIGEKPDEKVPLEPYPYQKKLIDNIVRGFEETKRGKLIAACGTGKTLVSKWIVERLEAETTLFIAPSLALIKQTLEEWVNKTEEPFDFLAVCSDNTVVTDTLDEVELSTTEVNFPVTTNPEEIKEFLGRETGKRKVIFSTYQSIDAIANALINDTDFQFDITIFDEAHRTAGNKSSDMYTYALEDNFIPSEKRLFMTATERIATPRIKRYANKQGVRIFSMDDQETYGDTLAELNFGQAIEEKIIADYEVVVCTVHEDELYEELEKNSYVNVDVGDEEKEVAIENVMKQIILSKAINELPIEKIITYHSTVKEAKDFINGSKMQTSMVDVLAQASPQISDSEMYTGHVNGSQRAGERKRILSEFEKSPYGIVSNAQVLTEGVDVPAINAIYFADPKNSTVDIIQALGRALRKKQNKEKTAYVLIPVILPSDADTFSGLNAELFDTVFSVVQALRDQDDELADIIDDLNYSAGRRKKSKKGSGLGGKIRTLPNSKIRIADFETMLEFKIGEVNKSPEFAEPKLVFTGKKNERKSSIRRLFTTIGDYKMESYFESNVKPTLEKFDDSDYVKDNSEIKINNNNISHTERIGAIEKIPGRKSRLTKIGKLLKDKPEKFSEVFKNQILKFYKLSKDENKIIFPYRALFKVLYELDYITKFEFTWCLYPLRDTSDQSIESVIERIKELRETYSNVEVLNDNNKEKVLQILNEKYDLELDYKDVWSSRSTAYNQFNYFKTHLLEFDKIFTEGPEKLAIYVQETSKINIVELLNKTKEVENKANSIEDVSDKKELAELENMYRQR